MKTKKITKKLNINKTTISNLEHAQMQDVKGGAVTWYYTCKFETGTICKISMCICD